MNGRCRGKLGSLGGFEIICIRKLKKHDEAVTEEVYREDMKMKGKGDTVDIVSIVNLTRFVKLR